MPWPPTSRSRSSTHRSLTWTSCTRWPRGRSNGWGSFLPVRRLTITNQGNYNRDKNTSEHQNFTVQATQTHPGGVGALVVILQHARQTKIRNFTLQVAVDQDVPGCQVTVHVAHIREVLHASSDPTQHPHELIGRNLSITSLNGSNINK